MASLSELLPCAAIRLDIAVADWRSAVRAAGGLLVTQGVSTDAYTDEMIGNIEENGPYVVVAPGLALVHARPSPAVHRTGLAWVRPAEPVEFGHAANDPVTLVVALAAADAHAHTAAMAALAGLLADPDAAAALRAAPSPQAVHRLLDARERGGGQPRRSGPAVQRILTVCGNGAGTSLFLKNTLERVLERWGWEQHVTVEATDTVSARGKASGAAAVLTSREIAGLLDDLGIPVRVVADFTSEKEVDAVLRDTYDV